MTNQQFLDSFYTLYDKVSTNGAPTMPVPQIQVLATEAQELLLVTGLSPESNRLRQGAEESEKRIQDFGELIRHKIITPQAYDANTNNDNGVFVSLPNSPFNLAAYQGNPASFDVFYFPVQEQAVANFKNCNGKYEKIKVYEYSHAEYTTLLEDPFNRPSKKRVWRLRVEGFKHELITDGTYSITAYILRYIRKPRPILLDGTLPLSAEVSELSEHKHREILRMTVDLAVRAMENTIRIQTEPKIIE